MRKNRSVISCCGVICSECEAYPKECKGCPEIEGKVYWLEYIGGTICDIYDCCIKKKYAHCGQCSELPCKRYENDDPTKTPEENARDHQKQLEQLKKMSQDRGCQEMNSSAFQAEEYDENIIKTIPFYKEMQEQVVSLVNTMGFQQIHWLDSGCGTGNTAERAVKSCSLSKITLADPSDEMLEKVKKRAGNWNLPTRFLLSPSEKLIFQEEFEVVTAVMAHHYLSKEQRRVATKKCYEALKPGGLYITFENIVPDSPVGKEIGLERWENYQINNGKAKAVAQKHISRFGKEYFPITISEHLALLKECDFQTVEILWLSYLQAGFYGIK